MTDAAKQARADYVRAWKAAHQEHIREYERRRRIEHADEIRARQHKYYLAHREARIEYQRKYRAENPEKAKASMEQYWEKIANAR